MLNCAILIGNATSTSNLIWSKTYGGSQDDAANCVVNTSDGGYVLAGYTSSYGNGTSNVWLIKTDATGMEQWNKTYGGTKEDVGYSVVQTKDGGYAVSGYTTSYGNGSMNVYLLKTDALGNMQWNRTYGGIMTDGSFSLAQTTDGGFIMTGFSYSYGHGGWDLYLIKTDDNGMVEWNKTIGGTNKDCGHAVIQTADGGYAITGYTKSYGNQGGDTFGVGGEDLWLVKTDASGNEQWNKTYGGKDYDDGFSILQNPDGGYTIAGTTKSFMANNTPIQMYSQNDTARVYLIRVNATGYLLWNETYGNGTDVAGFSLARASDGGYMVIGTEYTVNNSADIYAVRVNANGTELWSKLYGGTSDDYGFSVISSANNTFTIAGYTKSYGNGGSDVLLLKINDSGTDTGSNAFDISSVCGSLAILPIVLGCALTLGVITRKKK